MEATYRFAEHRGEVELELDAPTEDGIFDAAIAAFAELVSADGTGEAVCHELALPGDDRAVLLVETLNELVFLAEVEQFVPERLEEFELTEGCLHLIVAGHRGHPRPLVKAVTLNNLRFVHEGGAWHGRVVLDV